MCHLSKVHELIYTLKNSVYVLMEGYANIIVVILCAVDELKFNDHELRLKHWFLRSNLFVLLCHFN